MQFVHGPLLQPRPPTTMMNGDPDTLISSGSATMSSSKRTDLCVPGVFTGPGVSGVDTEKIDEEDEALLENEEAFMAGTRDDSAEGCAEVDLGS